MRGTVHGFAGIESRGGFGDPRSVDRSWRRAIEATDAALADWWRAL